MSREYWHIKEYEKEIFSLKEEGSTKREIGEKLGFSYEQIHNFISRHNERQRKLGAGVAIKKKGRPPKDYAVSEHFFSILKTECIYRVKLKTYAEASLLIGEYIRFYNNDRIQTKTKLTPLEKRSQYVA